MKKLLRVLNLSLFFSVIAPINGMLDDILKNENKELNEFDEKITQISNRISVRDKESLKKYQEGQLPADVKFCQENEKVIKKQITNVKTALNDYLDMNDTILRKSEIANHNNPSNITNLKDTIKSAHGYKIESDNKLDDLKTSISNREICWGRLLKTGFVTFLGCLIYIIKRSSVVMNSDSQTKVYDVLLDKIVWGLAGTGLVTTLVGDYKVRRTRLAYDEVKNLSNLIEKDKKFTKTKDMLIKSNKTAKENFKTKKDTYLNVLDSVEKMRIDKIISDQNDEISTLRSKLNQDEQTIQKIEKQLEKFESVISVIENNYVKKDELKSSVNEINKDVYEEMINKITEFVEQKLTELFRKKVKEKIIDTTPEGTFNDITNQVIEKVKNNEIVLETSITNDEEKSKEKLEENGSPDIESKIIYLKDRKNDIEENNVENDEKGENRLHIISQEELRQNLNEFCEKKKNDENLTILIEENKNENNEKKEILDENNKENESSEVKTTEEANENNEEIKKN